MNNNSVLHLYDSTYIDTIEDYLLVYNPLTRKGLAVLNEAATYLFKLINNKRTLYDIYLLAKKKDANVEYSQIKKIIDDFLNFEITYHDSEKLEKVSMNRQRILNVWFHITNQCNLRCKYCYIWKSPDKMSDQVAEKAIKKVIIDGKKHSFEEIIIKFSGGECLLELNRILRLIHLGKKTARQVGIKISFAMLTNGVLITPRSAEILKKYSIRVAISLDGLEKYHDDQRVFADGSGTFKYVMKGIRNLQASKVPFSVTVTITSRNIKNIPVLTKYLLDNNIRFVFNFYRENPCAQDGLSASNKDLITYLNKSYKIINDNLPRYKISDQILDFISIGSPHLFRCAVGHGYIIIDHQGKIASCPMLIDQPIGSINDKDIVETMIRGNFIKPRGLTVEGRIKCRDCQWKYVCCGGCPILIFRESGRYDVPASYCSVYKALIPEILRTEANRLIKYGFKQLSA